MAVLAGCASAPKVRSVSVEVARDYAARQVGDTVPTVRLRDEYQRLDTHISGDQPFRCNGEQSIETQYFLRIVATRGNRFEATSLQVDNCGEIREHPREGRFDDQYVYLYDMTFMNRLRIVDGGARLVPDRDYRLEDGQFTERVIQNRISRGSDEDSYYFGSWSAAPPVQDRRAAVQAMANRYRGYAANGREELRRERAEEAAARDRVAPVPMPTMSSRYSTPATVAPKASPTSSPSSTSTSTTSAPKPGPAMASTPPSTSAAARNGAGASMGTASGNGTAAPASNVTATSSSNGTGSVASKGAAGVASTNGAAASTPVGGKSSPARPAGGALIVDTTAADQRKAFDAQEAARAKQAAAANAEREAAAEALRAKLDAQRKADLERAMAEMKARGNKQ
jgi:hypothetical protein